MIRSVIEEKEEGEAMFLEEIVDTSLMENSEIECKGRLLMALPAM